LEHCGIPQHPAVPGELCALAGCFCGRGYAVVYAQARTVRPSDTIEIILNGRLQAFRVAGVALSPEFVFATRSALPLPDNRNFVVLWAGEDAVASAFDMRGTFNDVAMTLGPGAVKASVIHDATRADQPR